MTTNWSEILEIPPNELDYDSVEFVRNNLPLIDANALNSDELRKYFALSCFLIRNSTSDKGLKWDGNAPIVDEKVHKGSDTEESYYKQTIEELNRELAQYVYNKKPPSTASTKRPDDSPQAIVAIETKQELFNKIHAKNTHIKRLLIENEAHKTEIHLQNQKILMLNVSLKHTTHRLNQTIADLSEQKQQNQAHSGDMTDLHEQLSTFGEQMARIEEDKQAYKQNILHLGDEIHRKINQWNDLLKMKYQRIDEVDDIPDEAADLFKEPIRPLVEIVAGPSTSKEVDECRLEVSVLSEAVNKRNAIITEMEGLLIDLTMEISQSATVINRICKNLTMRETNLSSNLEKLRAHLARVLDRPGGSPANCVEYATQTGGGENSGEWKKLKSMKDRRKKGRKVTAERH